VRLRNAGVSENDVVRRLSAYQIERLELQLQLLDRLALLGHLQNDVGNQILIFLQVEISHDPLPQLELVLNIVSFA